MSRAPPFPTRRRAPSTSNSSSYPSQPLSAPGTSNSIRPLQVPRPGSRPTTPVNYSTNPSSYTSPSTMPVGPSRPQRSELRVRPENGGSERGSTASQDPYNRDSISTSRSDVSSQYRNVPSSATNTSANGAPPRTRPPRLQSPVSDDGSQTTPTSLTSALTAFRSAGSRRRQTEDDEDYQYKRERELEIEAEKGRQQRIRDRAPGVRRDTRGGEIDAVLDQVKDGWEFVVDPSFNNVDLALQLLDKSSLGKDMDSFRRTKHMLSKALKGSVDKHYQAFASSLPLHASLLGHLGATQGEISAARASLLEAKESLGSKRADLVQLWNRGQMLEEMIKLLDQIEHLKTVPDLLETLMSEKRLLQAAILLVRSLKIINKPDMLEIGAVSDLRSYLISQETALREILIDELQSHLYLKSFWCESRWTAYVPNQKSFPKVEFEISYETQNQDDDPTSPTSLTMRQSHLTSFLNNLSLRPNDPPHDIDDSKPPTSFTNGTSALYISSNSNPEADSFTYMETLLESLSVLGKLGTALDTVAQRVPSEIFALVEATLDEVEERAEFGRRRSMLALNGGLGRPEGTYVFNTNVPISAIPSAAIKTPLLKSATLRLNALESLAKRVDHEILLDLFWTVYSKLDAVAQGFRVVTEVANRIGSRRDFKDSSGTKPGMLFPLSETWNHVQTEVSSLIRDYLVDEQQGSAAKRNPIASINEVLRDGKFNRDKVKAVFRFADTDLKLTNKALRAHEDGLTRVLKDTMPGLAPSAAGESALTIISSVQDDRLLGADQHHRLLIRPDAFHVTVLFQPTLHYLHRVSEILPSGLESAQTSSAVLDEFVLTVYLPQLEEKVSDLFHEAVTGPEAFQPDPLSRRLSVQPLAKASTQLMALINSLCAMLATSPFHRENYARLILGVVIQFYQRCSDRFQALIVAGGADAQDSSAGGAGAHEARERDGRVALGAQWAQRTEVQACLAEMQQLAGEQDETERELEQMYRQETHVEMELLKDETVGKADLIAPQRNLGALASLHRSVSWFCAELNGLKPRADDAQALMSPTNLEPMTGMTPAFANMPVLLPAMPADELQLPLSKEMALRFQALLKTYDQLSTLILDTIRSDLRCRTIHYLDAAMQDGTYDSSYEALEPDPHIIDLNTELVHCNEVMSASLPQKERRYLFAGLGHLMEHKLIANVRKLRAPNAFGMKKMARNILALQQSTTALTDTPLAPSAETPHAPLARAKRYYGLFGTTPQGLLAGVRAGPAEFTLDEYEAMLGLLCGVDWALPDAEARARAADRAFGGYVIELHGMEMSRGGKR